MPRPSDTVEVLTRAGRRLYLAGSFDRIGAVSRIQLAAVDTVTGRATNWRPDVADGKIEVLAVAGQSVFVGGQFSSFGDRHVNGIVKLDARTGRARPWNAHLAHRWCPTKEPCTAVEAVAVAGSAVYVAGSFDRVSGRRHVGLVALDAHTGRALQWHADVDGHAATSELGWSLAVAGGAVYAAGDFSTVRGLRRQGIAALDARTGAVRPWHPVLPRNDSVDAFAVESTSVVIAYFDATFFLDESRVGLRSVDRSTGRSVRWTRSDFCCSGGLGPVRAFGSRLLVSSSMGVVGRRRTAGLAAFDPRTGRMLPWAPRLDGFALAFTASGSTLYVGGTFTHVNGLRRNRLAAFDLRTGKLLAWNPSANERVESLAVVGSAVYISGGFTTIGGTPRNGLAAVDGSTGAVTSWDPHPDAQIRTLAARGSTIYVAGFFTTIGGARRSGVAAVDAATGKATGWDPHVDGEVVKLTAGPNSLFVAGEFSHVRGSPRRDIAELDLATDRPTAFDAKAELTDFAAPGAASE